MAKLIGISRAAFKHGPQLEVREVEVDVSTGVRGDYRGSRPARQVTVLFREGWENACAELGVALPWLTRRANLLIEGMATPDVGRRLTIGALTLEVVQETKPCRIMEAAHAGLRAAMTPEWRGGICCRVVTSAIICVGDAVR